MPIALVPRSSEDCRAVLPEFSVGGQRGEAIVENDDGRSPSSSSSSIGRNSDESLAGGDADGDGMEVQSSAKDGALDNLTDLEEVLPFKRGISKFYDGKSKSFISLSDASSHSSLKDIVKPENAYTRKRKNLLAVNNFFDINSSNQHNCGGIYKKPSNSRTKRSMNESSSSPLEQKFSNLSLSDLQGAAASIPSVTSYHHEGIDKIH